MSWGEKKWMKINKKEEEFFDEYCKKTGVDKEKLTRSFRELERTTQFFQEIPELLKELYDKGYTLHILSNCGVGIQEFVRKHPETFSLFTTKNFSYELKAIKPEKEAFTKTLSNIQAKPEECIMIGDSLRDDIQGAEQVGLRTIHFQARKRPVTYLREQINTLQ